jgi:hypothetical protein
VCCERDSSSSPLLQPSSWSSTERSTLPLLPLLSLLPLLPLAPVDPVRSVRAVDADTTLADGPRDAVDADAADALDALPLLLPRPLVTVNMLAVSTVAVRGAADDATVAVSRSTSLASSSSSSSVVASSSSSSSPLSLAALSTSLSAPLSLALPSSTDVAVTREPRLLLLIGVPSLPLATPLSRSVSLSLLPAYTRFALDPSPRPLRSL